MMRPCVSFFTLISILTISAALHAAPTIITLNNGMEIMLIENHSNPVIASVVVVRTGSRNETIELNGATHFLEHLLFNGTETRTQKQLYDEMDFLGGYNNANTAYDRTTFMILLEKSNFEKGLEIQADMLFHSILPPDKFEKEKGIVIEEIGKDEDSESYRVERFFDQVIFRDTPYQWPILGSRQSIRNLTRDQVLNYYQTYYVPNNMVALIMGDFDTPEMLKTVERVFGAAPPRTLPEAQQQLIRPVRKPSVEKPPGISGLEIYISRGPVSNHHICASFNAPAKRYQHYLPFLVLTRIIENHLQGKLSSQQELGVTDVSVEYFCDQDFGRLNVRIAFNLEANCDSALAALRDQIRKLALEEITPEKVQSVVTSLRGEDVFNAERPHYYGMLKSADLAQMGPYFLLDYQKNLAKITWEEVNVAATRLAAFPPLVAMYQGIRQEDAGQKPGSLKNVVKTQLSNGLTAIVEENQDSQVFGAHFLFKNRSALESALGAKPGAVDFIHHLFDYGPAEMDREMFQSELQSLGAQVKFYDMAFIPYDDYYTTPEFSYIRVEVLDENYVRLLKLLSQTIISPTFTTDAVEATRGQMTGLARRNQNSVQAGGKALFASLIYGPKSPLAQDVVGTPQDVSSFMAPDLQRFHKDYFSPQNLILTVVTNNDADSVMMEIERDFGSWENGVALPEISYPRHEVSPAREEKPGGKDQSYLAMGYTFALQDTADRAPLAILNAIISDRMQFQLREREGLAYTLGSSVSFHQNWGLWVATMGTGPENLERAEAGIIEQLKQASKEKFTGSVVEKARNAYLGRLLMRGLARSNQAYNMGMGVFQDKGINHYEAWIEELRNVSAADVNRVVREYLKSTGMTVAIVR